MIDLRRDAAAPHFAQRTQPDKAAFSHHLIREYLAQVAGGREYGLHVARVFYQGDRR
jgi:hypothetical protein